jgi:hypothetical protein
LGEFGMLIERRSITFRRTKKKFKENYDFVVTKGKMGRREERAF